MGLLLAFAGAGAGAQLVDGTLGMGFGVMSATLLLLFGVAPVAASAATHAAKLPTTLVSGIAHGRAGNVDRAVLVRIAVPGMVAGFVGSVALTGLSTVGAKTWMSAVLLFFGAVIMLRFGFGIQLIRTPLTGATTRWLAPIGALGGFVDATGGGGWGPVVTPSLLTVSRLAPRKVVGTVSASEFLVAASVSTGFLTGAAHHDIPWVAVLGLVIGGVITAPIAARLAGRLPHALMGTLVGGLILLTNGITLLAGIIDMPPRLGWMLAGLGIAATVAVALRAWAREADAAVTDEGEELRGR